MAFLTRLSVDTRRTRQGLRAVALAACAVAAGAAQAQQRHDAAAWCADRCDQVVIDWNATTYQAIKINDGYADPMAASRVLAMVHLAMHDAVNATRPRYATYTQIERDAAADPAVAAVTAAHDVLAALVKKEPAIALLKTRLDETLLDAGVGASVTRGSALGKRVAAAVLQRRAGDGSNATLPYQPGTRPGAYRFTPGFDFLAAPHWRNVQPFALQAPSQYRSAPPPALDSAEYARAFVEVKETGNKAADARRTPDQSHYAAWWYEFSDIGWNRIARTVARERPQDLWQRARTFALLNVAMADSYIAGWDSKLHYDLWRPITAIRLADGDGNAQTLPDAAFEPLLPTPPVQDYPSTHSALGAAAAVVLNHAFGDRVAFQAASSSALPANPTRRFTSFGEAARENADSRVRAGIHFRFATVAGLRMGEQVGRHALQYTLAPLH